MKVNHIEKSIDGKLILEDITFELNKGEILGIIGRNGVGKTTLFRTLMNHYTKDKGTIEIDGKDIETNRELYEHLFYLDIQNSPIAKMTPVAIGKYYQKIYSTFDSEKYDKLIATNNLPKNKNYHQFSKGMQGLFNIILAISSNASYLILDEPFDGLDVIVKKQVLKLLLNEISLSDKAVLVSSHNLTELETLLDRALILKDGTIVNEYHLEEAKASMKKIQMVFKDKKVPRIIKENAEILTVQGRVMIGLFKEITPEMQQEIDQLNPVLFDEIPITLEDLFSSNLTDEADFQLFN
ncbi:MAG: ABC transporter ATP-binding protein [Vagococcus sp.]|uniref:ABC transporter ATP-binding protein n=1 Tax=Vagococcus sp. TaxID=1933889 RepID=UPI002FCAC4A7